MGDSLEKASVEETTAEKLMGILRSHEGMYNGEPVTETISFEYGLLMDSLDKYEFGFYVEKAFEIKMSDQDIQDIDNIQGYVEYINAYKSK